MTGERTLLERTAYHEAGHAVAGVLLGRSFDHVTITPEGRCLGSCAFTPCTPLLGRLVEGDDSAADELRQCVVTVMAGGAAEERFSGEPHSFEGEDDAEQAVDMASVLAGSPAQAEQIIAAAWTDARALWDQPRAWAAVEALAAALLERRTLEGAEARRLATGVIEAEASA